MADSSKGMMKWPLIIAAALVVLRVVLERLGGPESVNNIFGVAWLYFLAPIYFAWVITRGDESSPYRVLFKNVLLYGVYTRLMIMPTCWLAYHLGWTAPRFGLPMGGVVGDGVSPIEGYLWIPIRNAVFWVIFVVAVGMLLGSLTLLARRGSGSRPAEAG